MKIKIFLQKGEIVCGYILLNRENIQLNFGTEFPPDHNKENINKKTLSKFISDIDDLKSISKQIDLQFHLIELFVKAMRKYL